MKDSNKAQHARSSRSASESHSCLYEAEAMKEKLRKCSNQDELECADTTYMTPLPDKKNDRPCIMTHGWQKRSQEEAAGQSTPAWQAEAPSTAHLKSSRTTRSADTIMAKRSRRVQQT